eukprot:COSAG03_NODE_725_length_6077_cov_23.498829_6_plen_77_part_00
MAQVAPSPSAARDAARAERVAQHQAAEAAAAADVVTEAVIAAPDAWRQRVGGVAADGAVIASRPLLQAAVSLSLAD